MPRRKKRIKKNRISKDIEESTQVNNKIEDEIKEEIKEEKNELKEKEKEIYPPNIQIEKEKETEKDILKEENEIKVNLEKIIIKEDKDKDDTKENNNINNNENKKIEENNIKEENLIIKESELEKNMENNIINEESEIKENNDINQNEENKNILKIANIEYERFIKENAKLYQYIEKNDIPIVIQNSLFNKKDGIKLKNKSLLKIIKLSSQENEFKIYLTIQIITETFQFETSSNKNITLNQTVKNFITNKNNYNISFPKKEKEKINLDDILVSKESFIKIFSQIGMDYSNNIFDYLEFIITEISYECSRTKKIYVLKGIKCLKKLIEENQLFYINKNKNNNNEIIPLSNYSTKKIFDLFDGGKDTKYLLINYKIKNEDFINYEKENKIILDKLINSSDVKNMIKKYQIEDQKKSLKILKQEKLDNIQEINISDLDNYLNEVEQKLFSIKDKITNKKKEIVELAEEPNNQYIEVIDSEQNTKFINNQYLKLMKGDDDKFNKNIYSLDFYDYNNDKITVMDKNLDNLSKEEKIYIEVKINDNNYLVNKNKLLKIYDGWKILEQEDAIDSINVIKIGNRLKEYDNEKINIKLLDVNIIVQDIIKEIKINENYEDKNNNNNINNNNNNNSVNSKELNKVNEKEKEDNIIIIEEEENNINKINNIIDDKRKLRNKDKLEDKEKNKKKIQMMEYFNNLPIKSSYKIKYKVKTERIPKKK